MNTVPDIEPRALQMVLAILAAHLPAGAGIWVFGSRARQRASRASDLDLAIDAGRALTRTEAALLRDAFEESDLPYTVDLVDLATADAGFRQAIASDLTPLPIAGADGG